MRYCCFALPKDYLYGTVVLNGMRHNINVKLLRQWFISAESTKAVTEESIFRGKRALCLLCRPGQSKSHSGLSEKTLCFLKCKNHPPQRWVTYIYRFQKRNKARWRMISTPTIYIVRIAIKKRCKSFYALQRFSFILLLPLLSSSSFRILYLRLRFYKLSL